MRTALSVPYIDTSASDLVWALGVEPLAALAVHDVPLSALPRNDEPVPAGGAVDEPPARLQLRLLGSSHQAVLQRGQTQLSEVVACLPGQQGALPGEQSLQLPGATYSFASRTRRLPGKAAFAVTVATIGRLAARAEHSVVGAFPGARHALTALTARADAHSVRWRTWHTYPQTLEIVATTSTVRWT